MSETGEPFLRTLFLGLVFASSLAGAQTKSAWTTPQEPFQIADSLFYVGSRDLACFLVTTRAGNILINANLESSPPLIRQSIEKLGFQWADTRILLNSQAHFDHLAGAAAIIRQTGAKLMVMDGDVTTAESGGASDFAGLPRFPPARVERTLHDGDVIVLGGTKITAHKTPGHTRGCTTFSMEVSQAGRMLHVVIVGGLSALDSYRLVATSTQPESYPGIAQDFEHTFALLRGLPCDIFLGAHGDYFDMQEKLGRRHDASPSVWIDPQGYYRTVAEAQEKFEKRLRSEQAKSQTHARSE